MLTPLNGTNSPIVGTAPCSATPDAIRLDRVSFAYGSAAVLRDVTLAVPAGSFVTLLGPSGSGKTTLLRLIGGYLAPASGGISLRGSDAADIPPERRGIGTVFQDYALFPHLTVWKNTAFPLEVRRMKRPAVEDRVRRVLQRVGLAENEWHRRPHQLSGGQQQRAAFARALAFEPDILLLDEPTANLDRRLREEMRTELRRLHADSHVTSLMVTHDQEQALALSDRLAVLNLGRLLQIGPPRDVYERPQTPFVARSLGDANFLNDRTIIRPEHVVPEGPHRGVVQSVEYRGSAQSVTLRTDSGTTIRMHVPGGSIANVGQEMSFGVPAERCWTIPETDPQP